MLTKLGEPTSLRRTTAHRYAITVVLCVAIALVATVLSACEPAKPVVRYYGDSLAYETTPYMASQFGTRATVTPSAWPGAALCDFTIAIEAGMAENPAAVIVEFSGNNFTPCIKDSRGQGLTGAALLAKYSADAEAITRQAVSRRIPIFWVGAARTVPAAQTGAGAPVEAADPILNTMYRDLATRWQAKKAQVFYIDAGKAVLAPDGTWTHTLPCLARETANRGCVQGNIVVRSPDGFHYCPVALPAAPGGLANCPIYSSGAWRYAVATAAPVRHYLKL